MSIRNSMLTIMGLGLLATVSGAQAQLVIFSGSDLGASSGNPHPNSDATAASFDAAAAALGALNLITFESDPLGFYSSLAVAPGVTLTGADIGGSNQEIRNSASGNLDSLFGYNTTSGGEKFASLFGGSITFTFDSPVQAFGGYFSGVQLAAETLTFDDGSSQTIPVPDPGGSGVAFVGFTDAGKNIVSVTYHASNDITGVDDVRYVASSPSDVPEPGTFALLLGSGITGGLLLRRRARK